MSLRCRNALVCGAVLALFGMIAACESERRDFRARPAPAPTVAQVPALRAGPSGYTGEPLAESAAASPPPVSTDQPFQDSRWGVGEGKRLYSWFNCAGCHAPGGGGGMGPPFIDAEWRYGGAPHEVYASIVEGRPNGMPSFRDRMPSAEVWKLVGYVRTLGALTPKDVWPARADEMAEIQRESPRSGSSRAEHLRDAPP